MTERRTANRDVAVVKMEILNREMRELSSLLCLEYCP